MQSKNRARPMAARLIINPVQNKNRARPMAARLIINPVQNKDRARPMAARLITFGNRSPEGSVCDSFLYITGTSGKDGQQ